MAALNAGGLFATAHASAQADGRATTEAPSTPDQNTAMARKSFEAGVAAYGEHDYEAALMHFKTAMRLKPHPVLHVNLANCYDKLGRPIDALGHFRRFLSFNAGSPEQRTEVQAAIARLEAGLGSITVTTQPEGASISVDNQPVGVSPLRKHPVAAGQHTVSAQLEGHAPVERTVRVSVRGTATVAIHLSTVTTPATVAEAPTDDTSGNPAAPPDTAVLTQAPATEKATDPSVELALSTDHRKHPRDDHWLRRPGTRWVTTGVAAALLLGATITGIAALNADGDFEDNRALAQNENLTQRVRQNAWRLAFDDADRASGYATASDVLLLGTVIVGGAAAYLWASHWTQASNNGADALDAGLMLAPDGRGAQGAARMRVRF